MHSDTERKKKNGGYRSQVLRVGEKFIQVQEQVERKSGRQGKKVTSGMPPCFSLLNIPCFDADIKIFFYTNSKCSKFLALETVSFDRQMDIETE